MIRIYIILFLNLNILISYSQDTIKFKNIFKDLISQNYQIHLKKNYRNSNFLFEKLNKNNLIINNHLVVYLNEKNNYKLYIIISKSNIKKFNYVNKDKIYTVHTKVNFLLINLDSKKIYYLNNSKMTPLVYGEIKNKFVLDISLEDVLIYHIFKLNTELKPISYITTDNTSESTFKTIIYLDNNFCVNKTNYKQINILLNDLLINELDSMLENNIKFNQINKIVCEGNSYTLFLDYSILNKK